jgi:hypothetical protein
MKQFSLTSSSFTGEVVFKYSDDGYLIYYSDEADLNSTQRTWLLKNIPLTLDEMRDKIKSVARFNVIEIDFEVSFLQFWHKYNDKERSSKKRSESIFNKLTKTDQVKAYLWIDKYNRNRGNADKKYAETYLGAQQWNN